MADKQFRAPLRRWLHPGLRGKLFLTMVLILIPILSYQLWSARKQFQEHSRAEVHVNTDLAEAVRAAMVNFVHDISSTEMALGVAIKRGDGAVDWVRTLLEEDLPLHPVVKAVAWISPEGKILAASNPAPIGLQVGDRTFFREALQQESFVVSERLAARTDDRPAMFIARAIRNQGRVLGVLTMEVDLERLHTVLPMERTRRVRVRVVDRMGQAVYINDRPLREVAGTPPQSPIWAALKGEAFYGRFQSAEGSERIGAVLPVPEFGWAVAVTSDWDLVRAEARHFLVQHYSMVGLILLIFLAAAAYLTRKVLTPIHQVKMAALAIAQGDLSARVHLAGLDEVAEAALAFDRMADRIEELEHQRSRFLQIAAHELRNPMAGIKATLSLLQWLHAEGKPIGDLSGSMALLEKEIDRLSSLLDQVLEAYSLHEAKLPPDPEPVNLAEMISSALQQQVASSKVRFQVHGTAGAPALVAGNRNRLRQAIGCLLGNAVKYAHEGTDVTVTLEAEKDEVQVTVTNTGIGIPPDQLEKVFELFYRADNLQGRDPGGMGLGLFIVRRIVEQHGGCIWAESGPGGRVTFTLVLPMVKLDDLGA